MTENQKNSVSESVNPIDTVILELIESLKTAKTVVFCGAGISLHSGLPLANDLVRYVLKKIKVSEEETETILNSNIPFEAFIESLRLNSNVERIFDIFEIGEPNNNHFLLAKMVKAGYLKTICTSNFDQLIEKALESEGLLRGKDFQVFYKEDNLDHIDWDDNKIHLIKIHGSVEDRDNMAITLQQVASEVLSEHRKGVIEYIFSKGVHKNVLVMGYSCSDIFDISPQIEAVRKNYKKVIYIDHHESERAVKDISSKSDKNPFKKFKGSQWVLYDTDELVRALWDFYFHEDDYLFSKSTKDSKKWEKCVDDWSLETDEKYSWEAKYNIAGDIFSKISEYKSALKYFELALSVARDMGDKRGEALYLSNLGVNYDSLGDFHKAIEFYGQALSIAREIGEKQNEGNWLGNLGNTYYSLDDYHKAKVFYEQALNIARKIGDKQNEGSWLGNLGSIYDSLGDYYEAIEFYKQALAIFRPMLGDKHPNTKMFERNISRIEKIIKDERSYMMGKNVICPECGKNDATLEKVLFNKGGFVISAWQCSCGIIIFYSSTYDEFEEATNHSFPLKRTIPSSDPKTREKEMKEYADVMLYITEAKKSQKK